MSQQGKRTRGRSSKTASSETSSHATPTGKRVGLYIPEDPEASDDQSETIVEEGWKAAIEGFQQAVEHALKILQTSISKLEKDLSNAVEFQTNRVDIYILEIKMAAKERECQDFNKRITTIHHL